MSNINLCDCEEHWIEIKNKNNSKYLLSSKGRIYSYKNNKFIGCKNNDGYIEVGLFFSKKIHRLVYRYFFKINIEKYNKKYNEIDHINTIRNHNCICNFKICSRKENINNPLTLIKGKHSEETKKKMSESRKGKIPWNKNKKYYNTKKSKLSILKKGNKKYIVSYRNKGKRFRLSFYTEEEQKECELFINELYEEGLLL